ncbi:MAG TPA: mechanosensitive ion channel domain-containing protein [Mucilaginibacter sp.]|nr:mechanosensitive ion channel domain-containing protein [Mucilaginibacter sp.]
MYKLLKVTALSLLVLFAFAAHNGFAQTKKKRPVTQRETERKLKHSRDSVLQTLSTTDTSVNILLQRVEQYINTFNQINNNLANGLDTADISQTLPRTVKRLDKIQEQANTKKSSTLRYLFVLRDNLDKIQDRLDDWQSNLDDINTRLIQNQRDIVKFTKDTILKNVPAEIAFESSFFVQRIKLYSLWAKADSVNRSDLLKVNILQNKVSVAYTSILDETDLIDGKIKRFAERAVTGEFGYIWEVDPSYNNMGPAVNGTLTLNGTQLYYFLRNGTATHLIGLLFLLLVAVWIFYNHRKASHDMEEPGLILNQTNFIYKKPITAALLIPIAIVPYFYNHPPVAFLESLFLISIILVLILVRKNFPPSLFNFLHQLFWLTLFYGLSNLLVQITNFDRFLILALGIVSIIIAILFYKKVKREEAEEHLPYTRTALKIFIIMQVLSLILNLVGRFSMAKIVGITAVFNLWMLVSLYFVVRIIIQGLFLQFHTKKEDNSFISLIDYTILQKKFMGVLNTLAFLLWLFFLLQNLNIDDWAHDSLSDLLSQSRTIGGASFTFGGFVIFILVIWLSSLASKIVSYFYDVSAQRVSDLSVLKKKNRASTLLIRIGVFSAGFLLAVAASGFPLDKLTIIFSAFGVGIGFGLQNIVNNLVSGMILAFEKPVQIGDIIEVDNRSGTIKEIGIRSSKLATGDGSEVIIPNGDLISRHVVNWTLSNVNRRVELIIKTAYGTDIQKVRSLLKDLLENRDDIMPKPGPSVYLHSVTESSVDFRVFFWAADIANFLELKSKVLGDIYDIFRKENIQVPSGDKDINLRFPDDLPVIHIDSKTSEKPAKAASKKDINKTSPDQEK